jgi:rubrerythrin
MQSAVVEEFGQPLVLREWEFHARTGRNFGQNRRGNLQDAIRDTLYDAERYKQFAQEAAQDRDGNAAALFHALATDGEHRVKTLESALAQNQKPTT